MRPFVAMVVVLAALPLVGCDRIAVLWGTSLSGPELERFFRSHEVEGHHAAALKKSSLGGVTYLATIHGYPNNLAVCEDLIAPYNKDATMSTVPGQYFCEELRPN